MTLRLLAELDQQMAAWFQKETEFRVTGQFILRPEEMTSEQADPTDVPGAGGATSPRRSRSGGLGQTLTPDADGYALLIEGDLCLRVRMDDKANLEIIPITRDRSRDRENLSARRLHRRPEAGGEGAAGYDEVDGDPPHSLARRG